MSDFDATLRQVEAKRAAWRRWETVWNTVNYLAGGLSAALSATLGVNAHSPFSFMTPGIGVACASAAAALTSFLTVSKAGSKAAGFEEAAREIEMAVAIAKPNEPDAPDQLRAAEVRGILILKKH